MKPYIDKNTQLWAKANNEFEKDFFKLINNSMSGQAITTKKESSAQTQSHQVANIQNLILP